MTEKKLTESEIMKALECCSKPVGEDCNECPLKSSDCLKVNIEELALDLINRKNEEIERVTKERDNITKTYTEVVDAWKITRAKAIKEFAERVKEEIISDTAYGCDTTQHSGYYDYKIKIGDIPEYIDQIAKEMGVEL